MEDASSLWGFPFPSIELKLSYSQCAIETLPRHCDDQVQADQSRRRTCAYHPALLLSLLIYGDATGVYSSRRLQQATFDSVAFRYIAADQYPDHDTISTFRQRFLPQLQAFGLKFAKKASPICLYIHRLHFLLPGGKR